MNEEDKQTIKYIKSRLYGNEGCDYIDLAQKDLKSFVSGIVIENIENDFIQKQKIKDKIEELNKEIKSCTEIDAIFKIKQQQILQELIEESEK